MGTVTFVHQKFLTPLATRLSVYFLLVQTVQLLQSESDSVISKIVELQSYLIISELISAPVDGAEDAVIEKVSQSDYLIIFKRFHVFEHNKKI